MRGKPRDPAIVAGIEAFQQQHFVGAHLRHIEPAVARTVTHIVGLAAAVPGGYTQAQFIQDIQTLHSQGRFVVLSIGGQNGSFPLSIS